LKPTKTDTMRDVTRPATAAGRVGTAPQPRPDAVHPFDVVAPDVAQGATAPDLPDRANTTDAAHGATRPDVPHGTTGPDVPQRGSEPSEQDRKGPGRPRSPRADEAIIDAVLDLLAEGTTAEALAIETIAARAGVGKATIYRRWPNKEALLVD